MSTEGKEGIGRGEEGKGGRPGMRKGGEKEEVGG